MYYLYDERTRKKTGPYTSKELQERFDIKKVSTYAKTYSKVEERYLILAEKDKDMHTLLKEWDEITQKLRKVF